MTKGILSQVLVFTFICLGIHVMSTKSTKVVSDPRPIIRAEVQSCRGCALNRLKEIKDFIYDDLPKYKWASFKPMPGASPDLVLFNADNKEVERIALSQMTRKDCNTLMRKVEPRISRYPSKVKKAEL